MRHEYFIPCAPGVERTLYREVKALKLPKAEQQVGGVQFTGSMEDAWRANLELRTAVRVLQRLARFECETDTALYQEASDIDWSHYLRADGSFFVDAQVKDSMLTHSQYVAQRTKDAIVDFFRGRGDVRPDVSKHDADLRVHVHLSANRATISVDTSGDSLHKRGWRRYQGKAPISECLAAAMALEADWNRRAPVVDPFCGSGTPLIEAALVAADIAPGLFRDFGFEAWPNHQAAPYQKLRLATAARMQWPNKLQLHGRDLEAKHIAGLQENLASLAGLPAAGAPSPAQLERSFQVEAGDALEFPWRPGWGALVLSNLPYGVRISQADKVEELHRAFGQQLRDLCHGYTVALMVGDKRLAHHLGLQGWEDREIRNGSLQCRLLTKSLD